MPRKEQACPGASAVERAIASFFTSLPRSTTRFLVALSGGPDSVALLVSSAAEAGRRGLETSACWIDHGIRPVDEIQAERAFVEALCQRLGVPLVIEAASRGAILGAAAAEGGVEAAARRFRYAALEKARLASASAMILTGHNSDDFLETMIMRFCTGAGTAGLRGIPAVNGAIARPLLGVTKAEVLAYLGSIGQPYRVDSTNAADDYLRNRVRHEVLPALVSVFPSLRASLETLALKAAVDEDALARLTDALLASQDGDDNEGAIATLETAKPKARLSAEAFQTAPKAVRVRALYRIALHLVPERLPWRLVEAAADSGKAEGRLASGAGVEFVKEGGYIHARPYSKAGEKESGPEAGGFGVLAYGPGVYRIGKAAQCTIYSSESAPGLRLDAFSWPLWIRSRRPGDAIRSGDGLKPIDGLLGELGVALDARDRAPIIEDRGGIVAVLGSRVGGRDRYRRNDDCARVPATGFLLIEMKGVELTHATR